MRKLLSILIVGLSAGGCSVCPKLPHWPRLSDWKALLAQADDRAGYPPVDERTVYSPPAYGIEAGQ